MGRYEKIGNLGKQGYFSYTNALYTLPILMAKILMAGNSSVAPKVGGAGVALEVNEITSLRQCASDCM